MHDWLIMDANTISITVIKHDKQSKCDLATFQTKHSRAQKQMWNIFARFNEYLITLSRNHVYLSLGNTVNTPLILMISWIKLILPLTKCISYDIYNWRKTNRHLTVINYVKIVVSHDIDRMHYQESKKIKKKKIYEIFRTFPQCKQCVYYEEH